ncbi:MAG: response regulator [Bacteroidota bacterium]
MTDNIKIIQDICLLYELSLAVGGSLDAHENCKQFLRKLISRKSLNFASVWLHREDGGDGYCELFYITPTYRANKRFLSCTHPVLRELMVKPYLSIGNEDPEFDSIKTEKNVDKGSYALFRLGKIGILTIFSSSKMEGFGGIELAQLKNVVDKFAISLEGCLAHGQLKDEIDNREIAQTRLTNLITNLQAGILFENEKREVILTNQNFCDTLNIRLKPEQLIGQNLVGEEAKVKDIFSDAEGFLEGVDRTLKKRELVTGKFVELANGKILEWDFIPLFSGSRYLGHLWQFNDVTARRKAQQVIQESEEKYRGIIENMELGLLEVDLEHNILRPYKYFCEMLGYTAEELIGKNALELLVVEEYHDKMKTQDEIRLHGVSSVYEVQLKKKDGSLMWALISGAPINDNKGNIVGSIGVHYDLTDRKRLETDLAEAKHIADQARQTERQFLVNMSHEIRTPMNAVIGMTYLLGESDPTPVQKDFIDSLRFSADTLLGIIDNILDFSKIEAGELQFEEKKFNLKELLAALQQTFQFKVREKSVSVNMDFDPEIENLVIGDPHRLNQILTNLLGNASKFTDHGSIGIGARMLAHREGAYEIEFSVQDTGIGIPPRKLQEVFKNFKQADPQVARKYGGTGLGLTIVKQLVELQGGSIRVESKLEQGSTFSFVLSFKDSGIKISSLSQKSVLGANPSRHYLEQLNILVVEDNAMNQKLISKILESWKCQYEIVNNGKKAISITAANQYDIILMDIHMPEMGGVEAARNIRQDSKNPNQQTPIIALTAAALLEEKKRALNAGMDDFLTRPFSPSRLEECVLRFLGVPEEVLETTYTGSQDLYDLNVKVDLQYLFEFSNGDHYFVKDMVDTFNAEMPSIVNEINAELACENWSNVAKIVHKLKSNFMMFGMSAQHAKSLELENMLKRTKVDKKQVAKKIDWLARSIQVAQPMLEQQTTVL